VLVSCTSTACKPQRHEPASGSHEQAPRMRHDNTSRKPGALRARVAHPAGLRPATAARRRARVPARRAHDRAQRGHAPARRELVYTTSEVIRELVAA